MIDELLANASSLEDFLAIAEARLYQLKDILANYQAQGLDTTGDWILEEIETLEQVIKGE